MLKAIISTLKVFKRNVETIKTLFTYKIKKQKIFKIENFPTQTNELKERKILALYFDGLPAKRMEIYGGPIPTPNFKKLANQGTLFKEMIVASPSTAMTLTSMFTGLFPHEFGRFSWNTIDTSLPENCVLLIDILLDAGFKIYFLWDETFMSIKTQNKFKIIDWDKKSIVFLDIAHKDIQSKQVSDLLNSLNRFNLKRWFCFVRFSDTSSTSFIGSAKSFSPYSWDDETVEADAILGQILKIVDETVEIIVFSDHGKSYGQKGILKYSFNLSEQTLHVPFLCSWGNGCVKETLTSIIEFPNIILHKPLKKHKYLYADTAYAHQWNRNTMIREGRWKYIYNRIGFPAPEEFYDLKYDPNELINLAGKYKDPYRDSRPKGDTISKEFSPSGLNLDGKDVSEVYPRNDWDVVKKKLNKLRKERERIWHLQGVNEKNYE